MRRSRAGVAQLVEQRIRNAKVVGSTPISGTTALPLQALFAGHKDSFRWQSIVIKDWRQF